MLKHIVMWKLKEEAEGRNRMENAQLMKEKLESLDGVIDELISIEVGIDVGINDFDVVLYSEFRNREDLEAYMEHAEHKKVSEFVSKIREDRVAVDYEV